MPLFQAPRWILVCLFTRAFLSAADYYVSPTGNDSNNGTSPSTPFNTLQRAEWPLQAGDTIWVMNGTHTNTGTDYILWLNPGDSGTAVKPTSIRAYPGHTPVLSFTGWGGIGSTEASYILIEGLTIVGPAYSITQAQADADAALPSASARFNGGGITIDGRYSTNVPHHWTIRNCRIEACPGGAIATLQTDYLTVENNLIVGNAWWSRSANSGISLYQPRHFDTVSGYHNRIVGNKVWNNKSLVKWDVTNALSDGNGIIIDDTRHTQNGSTRGAYTARTLVANNAVAGNGGAGIQAYLSDHVDIVGNTSWQNSVVLNYGEIYAYNSSDVALIGNIMAPTDGRAMTSTTLNINVTYDRNLYFGGPLAQRLGTNSRTGDPRFVSPGVNLDTADFRLLAESPAIDLANDNRLPVLDQLGQPRSDGPSPDAGAYEFQATALQSWRRTHWGVLTAAADTADTADPDGDGIPNLLEYALAIDPLSASGTDIPVCALTPSGTALQLTFFRARLDLTYEVLASSDLLIWTVIATNPGGAGEEVTVTDPVSINSRRFLRLSVTSP